jgi:hypothetical protein
MMVFVVYSLWYDTAYIENVFDSYEKAQACVDAVETQYRRLFHIVQKELNK